MRQGLGEASRQRGTPWRAAVITGLAAVGFALLALAPPAAAATVLGCPGGGFHVTEDMTLTLDGSPYLTCGLRVSAGTFTIEPGVRIEVTGNTQVVVFTGSARLVANGTAAEPIVFTRGGTGLWGGLVYQAAPSQAPVFENVTIEHTGACGDCPLFVRSPALQVEADLAVKGCVLRHGTGAGISGGFRVAGLVEGCDVHHMQGDGIALCCGAPYLLRGNTVHDNGGVGIFAGAPGRVEGNVLARNALPLRISENVLVRDNAFDGNADHAIEVSFFGNGDRIVAPTLWQRNLDASGAPIVYHVLHPLNVEAELTIEPGAILAFGPGANLNVQGGLDARGTEERPILMTSAAAQKAPGDWGRVAFGGNSAGRVRFENVTIEYAGGPGGESLYTDGGTEVANCVIRHGAGSGAHAAGGGGARLGLRGCDIHHHAEHGVHGNVITVSDSRIHDNAGVGVLAGHSVAVDGTSLARNGVAVRMHQGTHLAATNTFDGNSVNEIQVTQGVSFADVSWPRFTDSTTGQVVPYHLTDFGNYDFLGNLAIAPGNVLEFASQTSLSNRRAFIALGTTEAPILFTSDQAVKAAGQWRGLKLLSSSDLAVLENVTLEAAGNGPPMSGIADAHAAIQNFRSAAVLKNCELRGNKVGLEILSDEAPVRVEGCTLRGHDLAIGAFPNSNLILRGNRIVGNAIGVSVGAGPPMMRADNNVFDNLVNAVDRQGVSWSIPKTAAPGGNILGNPFFGGNAWSDYKGVDCTGDGLGDTLLPYRTQGAGQDRRPLVQVGLDTVPPVSTATPTGMPGNAGWWRSAVTVSLKATDDWCGVEALFYSVDGGVILRYTGPFVVAGDGEREVLYWAEDRAGNAEAARKLILPIDTTPPNVRLVDPVRGNVYVDDVGVPLVLRGPCAASPAADACDGFDALARRCPDVVPQATCEAQPFDGVLDLTVLVGTKTLGAEAEDATSGIALVTFEVEGRTLGGDVLAPYTAAWDTRGETLDRHAVWAVAEDVAGNRADGEAERPITVPLEAALLLQGLGAVVADVDGGAWCRGLAALVQPLAPPCAVVSGAPPLGAAVPPVAVSMPPSAGPPARPPGVGDGEVARRRAT